LDSLLASGTPGWVEALQELKAIRLDA